MPEAPKTRYRRTPVVLVSLALSIALSTILLASRVVGLYENVRVEEYEKRNYTWPLEKYVPDTPGWKSLMEERLEQVQNLADSNDRYEGFMQTIYPAILAPNFTEFGFGLARVPTGEGTLMEALRQGIRQGLASAGEEGADDVIDGPIPLYVDRSDLTSRVLQELHAYPEAWAGMDLIPYRAYGFRVYRNQSALWMHVDKPQTHVLSFILHIDSSEDSEPWPIFIEDFNGNTHEVVLTHGDMLFYESSKCFHGRPRRFNGSWYSSVFVHYYPKHGWMDVDRELESHYAIPPIWRRPPSSYEQEQTERLEMRATSMIHPNCPDNWCLTKNAIKWGGPGEEGFWIDPLGRRHILNVKSRPTSASRNTASRNDDEL